MTGYPATWVEKLACYNKNTLFNGGEGVKLQNCDYYSPVLLLVVIFIQVLLECLLASVLCCCGILGVIGEFKDTRLTTELNARYGRELLQVM